jgi:hypothetical protein
MPAAELLFDYCTSKTGGNEPTVIGHKNLDHFSGMSQMNSEGFVWIAL